MKNTTLTEENEKPDIENENKSNIENLLGKVTLLEQRIKLLEQKCRDLELDSCGGWV